MVSSYKAKGQLVVESGSFPAYYYTTLGYVYVKINNLFRIQMPAKKNFYFLNAGISNGYGFMEKNSLVFKTNTFEDRYKAIAETRKWEFGILAGGGIGCKKLSFEVRGELANGMSGISSLRSFSERIHFLLGYTF